MIRTVRAKLHGIQVTDANLAYHGSITLDPAHCEVVGIYPLEFVEIWNKTNGNRISTYVIFGERGSNCCVLNGAAARTCQKGDEIIICASQYIQPGELYDTKPKVLTFKEGNLPDKTLEYDVYQTAEHEFNFKINR